MKSLLLDTHALLWWFADDPKLSKKARSAIAESRNTVYVSTAAVWEIVIKKSLGKLNIPYDLQEALADSRFLPLAVTFNHALAVEHLEPYHHDPFDRIQIAPGVTIPISVTVPRPSREDEGRKEVTGFAADLWRYRTPTLRNVAVTAPYMHDGSLPDLEAVIDFYDTGAGTDPGRDPGLIPLELSDQQKSDLLAFLKSLSAANLDALAADARSAPIGDRLGDRLGDRRPASEDAAPRAQVQ